MSRAEREKGLRGQQEVTRLFRSFGIEVDKLQESGDRIAYIANKAVRLEAKNHDKHRTRMADWIAQAESETPAHMYSAVVWKHGGRWRVDMDAETFLTLLS